MLGPVPRPGKFWWGKRSELCKSEITNQFELCLPGIWTCQLWFWFVYFCLFYIVYCILMYIVHSWIRLFNILFCNQLDVHFNALWFWWCKSGITSAPLFVAPERSSKGEHGRLVVFWLSNDEDIAWHCYIVSMSHSLQMIMHKMLDVNCWKKDLWQRCVFDFCAQMVRFSGCLPEAERRWVQGLVGVFVCVGGQHCNIQTNKFAPCLDSKWNRTVNMIFFAVFDFLLKTLSPNSIALLSMLDNFRIQFQKTNINKPCKSCPTEL